VAAPESLAAPGTAIERVLELGYRDHLREGFLDADARTEDIRQLAAFAAQFPDTLAFLSEVSLLTEISAEDAIEVGAPDEYVTLSSIHRAKGLEWRAVFVVWLAEGHFPSLASLGDPQQEEEERRCFYVALTRARDELHLVHPILAAPRDGERHILRPSRFLTELAGDERLWETWNLEEGDEPEPPPPPSRSELRELARKLLETEE
jgi:DNA helicase-2/ATP-dependent DNA helicase PcrA